MLWDVNEAVREVKVAIDMNTTDALLAGEDDQETLTLDEIIESKIEEGVKAAHMAAPAWLLELGYGADLDPEWDEVAAESLHWEEPASAIQSPSTPMVGGNMERYWGWVLLPEDFMRLVVFEMSDWEQAVYEAITPADPRYKLQRGRIAGLRGNPQRPVCALGIRPEGRVLEFYSCRSRDAEVTRAVYIPQPKIEDGAIWVSPRCQRGAVYAIGALTLATMGEAERSAILKGMMESELHITHGNG